MKKIILFIMILILIFSFVFVSGYTKEELKNNGLFDKELNYIDLGYDYYVKKMEFKDNSFVTMGYCFLEKNDESDEHYPYIAYYENDELMWYKIETKIKYGSFNSCIITDNRIICVGEYGYSNKGSFIYSYDFGGVTYENKLFNVSRNLIFKKIYEFDNKLYVVGETNSKDMLNKKTLNTEVFIYELDDNLNVKNTNYFGNLGNNAYIDSVYFQDCLCILMKVDGSGYYEYNKLYPYILVMADFRIDLLYYEKLDFGKELRMITVDKYIYITDFDEYNNIVKMYQYDERFDCILTEVLAKPDKNNLIYYYDYSYDSTYDDFLFTFTYRDNDDVVCFYKIKNDKKEYVSSFDTLGSTSEYMYKTKLYKGFIYELGGRIGGNNHGIILSKIAYLKFLNDTLYVNGYKATSENIDVNKDVFGYYDGEVIYDFEGEKIAISGKYYVPLKINIEKDSTYNTGLTLVFNGEGKLNGKRINSGTTIDEVGNYVLEIYGKDDTSYYHFTVEDMKIIDKESDYKPLSELTSTDYNHNSIQNNNNNKNFNYIDSLELNYSYLIGICIICFALGLIPFKKIISKHRYDKL